MALPSLIDAGLGVAVLPALAARPMTRDDGFVFRPLHPGIWRQIYLVRKPGRGFIPAASALVRSILNRVRVLEGDGVRPSTDWSGFADVQ